MYFFSFFSIFILISFAQSLPFFISFLSAKMFKLSQINGLSQRFNHFRNLMFLIKFDQLFFNLSINRVNFFSQSFLFSITQTLVFLRNNLSLLSNISSNFVVLVILFDEVTVDVYFRRNSVFFLVFFSFFFVGFMEFLEFFF